jgi:hypothetical protein
LLTLLINFSIAITPVQTQRAVNTIAGYIKKKLPLKKQAAPPPRSIADNIPKKVIAAIVRQLIKIIFSL